MTDIANPPLPIDTMEWRTESAPRFAHLMCPSLQMGHALICLTTHTSRTPTVKNEFVKH